MSTRPDMPAEDLEIIRDNFNDPGAWPADVRSRALAQYGQEIACPVCFLRSDKRALADSYTFNMPVAKIALRAEQLFLALDRNADFLLVQPKQVDGLQRANQYLTSAGRSLAKYGEKLDAARERDTVFYQLDSVLKDIAAGSAVATRVAALIRG